MKQVSPPNETVAKAGWRFGFLWTLVNAIAWALGFVTGCDIAGPVGGGLLFGVGVALAPWLMLQDRFSWSRWQPLASILVGAAIGMVSFGAGGSPVFIGLAIGAALGITQWFELRRHVSRAGWWVLAMLFGMSGGMVVGFGISCSASPLAGFVGGIVASAITAVTIVWLLQKPKEWRLWWANISCSLRPASRPQSPARHWPAGQSDSPQYIPYLPPLPG